MKVDRRTCFVSAAADLTLHPYVLSCSPVQNSPALFFACGQKMIRRSRDQVTAGGALLFGGSHSNAPSLCALLLPCSKFPCSIGPPAQCARQDSNLQPRGSKPRALSNCATGAQTNRREFTGKSLPVKLCIKNNGTGREIQIPDKCRRLGCAVFSVHVLVFPFHRQGALILNFI